MLFDLRGRGRQRTVKVIYLTLAVLMGGGLVLFGIGGNTNGGLVDAITGNGSSAGTGAKEYRADIRTAERELQANRQDEQAWVDLIRARANLARTADDFDSDTGTYGTKGKAQLRDAAQAWTGYEDIEPKDANLEGEAASVARTVYIGLEDDAGVVGTAEVIAENKNTAQAYAQLAAFAYQAGQTRKGDLAGKKAISLAEPGEKQAVKSSIDQAKAAAPTPTPSAVPSATATPTPKG